MHADSVRVVLTIDVEEEGLFGGSYARTHVGVSNVGWLTQLIPLLQECDLPVTLLCTHSVFTHADACRALDTLRRACQVEIGAHLHHWNTPPLEEGVLDAPYKSTRSVPDDLMLAKLHTLFTAGHAYAGQALTSFRMGKWDLHPRHWSLLQECGVRVDASVRPLHCGLGGPDHFFAPSQPYIVRVPDMSRASLVEVPLTCAPVLSCVPRCPIWARPWVQKCGIISVLPIYHPLWYMQWATRRLLARGIRVLTLAWHSSEMMPGGAPHMPHAHAVQTFLTKLRKYLLWLRQHWNIHGMTLDNIYKDTLCPM